MLTTGLSSTLSGLLSSPVVSTERIGGGRNSQVYKATCEDACRYVAKFYPGGRPDGRDCLDAEFTALSFLSKNGVDCVPRPVAVDRANSFAVYEFVEGEAIPPSKLRESDIDEAVLFLATLKELRSKDGSVELSAASDAGLSIQAMFDGIERRFNTLMAMKGEGHSYSALGKFLENEFSPCLAAVQRRTKAGLDQWEMSPATELEWSERTLSPSDFGFHNALRRPDGRVAFLDFEYFGWDDPAKMIADFLLHPAMRLPSALKKRFLGSVVEAFGDQQRIAQRVDLVYPLSGLKWCLLLLNEFVPEHLVRRGFADGAKLNKDRLQMEQLSKATAMLRTVLEHHELLTER